MKKITRKIMAAMSAAVMCAVPMMNSLPTNAATTQYKTYLVVSVAQNPNIAYFDFVLNYDTNILDASPAVATSLCKNGSFTSSVNTSKRKILHTYNGNAIGARGYLCTTKFVAPMDSDSIFDYVWQSDVKIRNASGATLSPTSITMDEVLMGDVDLNGVVDNDDAQLVLNFIGNRDHYPLTARQQLAADVYQPGSGITAMDSLEIQRYAAGVIAHF